MKLIAVIPYYLVILLNWGAKDGYQIFTSAGAGEEKLYEGTGYYQGNSAGNLVNKLRTLQPDKKWADHLKVIWNWGKEKYLWENIYTTDAYQQNFTSNSPSLPPTSTPWIYWHAYYLTKERLLDSQDKIPVSSRVESLWYSGLKKVS